MDDLYKLLKLYGLAGALIVVGSMIWMLQSALVYLAWLLVGFGVLWLASAIWRSVMPAVESTVKTRLEMSQQEHDQWMALADLELRRRVISMAEQPGRNVEYATNGTISVTHAPRVQVTEEKKHLDDMPQRLLLPAGRPDECLYLSPDFRPHADTILSQRGMIVGISGSGKSNSVAALHEELGRLLVPFLLIDTENEYGSLVDSQYLPRGQRFDVEQITAENAKDFGWWIIENHIQAVLDISSYAPDEAAYVVVNTLAGLQEWEEALENENRLSFMVTLSEAGAWFPQGSKVVPYSDKAYSELQTTFFTNLVPRGRKRGLGLTFDLQRPAQVDKRLMQTSWKILHRQTEPRDIEIYKKIAGLEHDDIVSLADGEAYIFSSQVSSHRVQIRKRYTEHEANTPGLASIKRRQLALSEPETFGRNSEISDASRNAFDERIRPFRRVPKSYIEEVRNQEKAVPEGTKRAILDLYSIGKKRTEIQEELSINGDEYWMVKLVCNEYDQQQRRTS